MKKLTDYQNLIVFDLETTGFDPNKNQIIELSLMVLNPLDLSIIKNESHLILSKRPIPVEITKLTGITQKMTKNGLSEDALFQILKTYNDPSYLWLAYNIQFDIGFIESLFNKYQIPFSGHLCDVMAIYKDNQAPPHALKNAIETYQVTFQNTHRATDDVLATIEVFKALKTEVTVEDYINVIGYHPKYGLKGPKYPWVSYYPQENIRGDLKTNIRLNKGE